MMFNFPKTKPAAHQKLNKRGEAFGWCHGATREMLRSLINEIRPKVIAEIGSFMGQSTNFLCDSSDAKIYCIDHWKGSKEHQGIYRNIYDTFIVNVLENRKRIKIVKGTSVCGLVALKTKKVKPSISER